MAGNHNEEKRRQVQTLAIGRRKLIGQAIIDGLLSPSQAALLPVASDPDYDQGQGDYTQKGGDHNQSGGGYNQSQALENIRDQVTNVIRDVGGQVIR